MNKLESRGKPQPKKSAADHGAVVTTTIALDEETHRRLRHLAIEQKTSFRELIRDAIREYLARRSGGR